MVLVGRYACEDNRKPTRHQPAAIVGDAVTKTLLQKGMYQRGPAC